LLPTRTVGIDAPVPGEVTRVISDLHFGDQATRVRQLAQLRPLLEGVSHLVLNGDALDTRPGPYPAHSAACRAEVLDFFPRAVPKVTFLTGNHDADLSPDHRLDLAGGQVFVTHGDIIFDTIVPWGRDAGMIGEKIAARLTALPGEQRGDLDQRLAVWRQVAGSIPQRHQSEPHSLKYTLSFFADTLWPPWRFAKIAQAWQEEAGRLVELVRRHRPRARYVIAGHLHRTQIRRDASGIVTINTGSFCPPLGGYAVDLIAGRLIVRRVERRQGGFHAGAAVAEFPLDGA
jgi:predicted phosphodiesterase